VSALLSNRDALKVLKGRRGLKVSTIEHFRIGWKPTKHGGVYTIPILDIDGELANIRYYQPDPPDGRRKIWGVTGLNAPRLFPLSVLDDNPRELAICEGELDAIIAWQEGIPAITRTGAADVWKRGWNEVFRGRVVYLAHDADVKGQLANKKVAASIRAFADSVHHIKWPYEIEEKHGKDVTDFLMEFGGDAFRALMKSAREEVASKRPKSGGIDAIDASIMETLDSQYVGRPLRIMATVQGKQEPGFSIPKSGLLTCSMDKGKKCQGCPLYGAGGEAAVEVDPTNNRTVLSLINASDSQMLELFREDYGALKCDRIKLEVTEYQPAEIFHVRPSIDQVEEPTATDHTVRKITNVGRHDTAPNTTVQITGSLFPDPRSQKNEFVAWNVEEQETSIDKFSMDEEKFEALRVFRPHKGQSPLEKAIEISRNLSEHVTRIIERDEMHVFMDLIYHSVLSFEFDRERIDKGGVEGLIIGDTRTGKSLAAERLARHYRAGEMVSCEAASFAGIIGGIQKHGSSDEWTLNWGVIPLNNGRHVTLDEVSGLSTDQIAEMSSVRSSGIAELRKVKQGRTAARTRLCWLGNPRDGGKLDSNTYGVDAIHDLIGNNEDISRFTMAMAVKFDPALNEQINRPRPVSSKLLYTSELCHQLVMWAWSRKSDQVMFTEKATRSLYQAANAMGQRYIENPPLIQAANVRVKLASLAVAIAARTFSTDKTGEIVVVRSSHIKSVVKFLDRIYTLDGFGYLDRSNEHIADEKFARKNKKRMTQYLKSHSGLAKFLRGSGRFKRQDIEEVLNYDRTQANGVINSLHRWRMVRKDGGFVIVTPVLHELLRESSIE
jgi:hypothetical protein